MPTLTSGRQRLSALAASALAATAGGAMDAWVYLAHGHVFANAQTGNVVLMSIALADGDIASAATHLPSLLAFVTGVLVSRLSGHLLKRSRLNSRNVRLGLACVMLVALGLSTYLMSDRVVTACVGFIAGVMMTSLSHIGTWSFNTGMITGNLLAGVSALAKALTGSAEEWPHATAMVVLCFAFFAGAAAGAWLTPRLGGTTLLPVAVLIAAAVAAGPWALDPIPDWSDLE
ncbi:MAG TPA: YoaK family protein [Xanthobacteraceae bacterium]